jgi:OOP family OmpA-OmpF porin
MRKLAIIGLLPALTLVVSGCATKKWVTELVGKKEVEIDQRTDQKVVKVETRVNEESQRVNTVEARVKEEATRVEGIGFKVTGLETQVGEVRTVATGAKERADAAYGRADEVNGRLTRLWNNRHARNLVETIQVPFAFNKADLSDNAQTSLASLVKELKENPRLGIELEGYTDGIGARDYNYALSQRRVEAVRRYLVEQGIELPRIASVGMGPIAEKGLANEQKRRVTVKLTTPAD